MSPVVLIFGLIGAWPDFRFMGSDCRLEFLSHGNVISFGKFLTADERSEAEAPLRRFVTNICGQTRPSPV